MKRTQAPPRTTIFLVDDHPMMREGLAQLIDAEPDLEVCGEAGDAATALERVAALKPALVLTDISLPGRSGIELTKDIVAMQPDTLVLVISMHDESLYAERVLRAGGRGYIMKQEGGKRILRAIRCILGGQISLSEHMAATMLESFSDRRINGGGAAISALTDRELEVFQQIGRGLGTREVAAALHISPKTVETHRINIKAKLKIATQAEFMRLAVRWDESRPGE
jgi:DNA-binding NarL/FixJ family response regulator